eukprot:gene6036-6648_t
MLQRTVDENIDWHWKVVVLFFMVFGLSLGFGAFCAWFQNHDCLALQLGVAAILFFAVGAAAKSICATLTSGSFYLRKNEAHIFPETSPGTSKRGTSDTGTGTDPGISITQRPSSTHSVSPIMAFGSLVDFDDEDFEGSDGDDLHLPISMV